jgi:hypothetical protein
VVVAIPVLVLKGDVTFASDWAMQGELKLMLTDCVV